MMDQQHLHLVTKKPKLEEPEEEEEEADAEGSTSASEQEEALVALIEHRTKEVQHLRQRTTYYQSQLEDAERRLNDTHLKLGRLRRRSSANNNGAVKAEVRSSSASPVRMPTASSSSNGVVRPPPATAQPQSRPPLIIPSLKPRISTRPPPPESTLGRAAKWAAGPVKSEAAAVRSEAGADFKSAAVGPVKSEAGTQRKDTGAKTSKRKLEQKEHTDLILSIRSHSSPSTIRFQQGAIISSHHKRKLRSLELNPVNDQLFVTSALDGVVNLWQVQAKGPVASLLSATDCLSPKQRRWPEDIAWHPDGDSLFSVYNADGGDTQISILNLNSSREKNRVTFLQEKPHVKGIINSIRFMPWVDACFMTGGSDHAVIHWHEKDDENAWKPKAVHRNIHSSGVMGVAGLQQKKIILSVGADKRIIGFDMLAGRADFRHQIESKCMSVLPNPSDFNLFMVQTGAPERQLRLFDIRLRQTEIHAFGWKQESSESQSALINQAWSPDGLYITSGSADPTIHIFDIRYDARKPCQSVQAHQKRVFKAVWHQSQTLLISISSDLNIGLHRIT